MRIAHMADIHIKNLKYHDEYRTVFSNLYEKLGNLDVDIIYVGGDIAHTKTQLSPEYFEMCSDFLSSLADIAPTYVILGNHDGNLRTASRQDAVTPVFDALKHPQLFLMKDSVEIPVGENIVFNNLSIFDTDNWIEPTDPDAINIAFYHGAVSGCSTDVGWVMSHGEHEVSIFEEFDFAMLGDIHKTNQSLDKEGRVRYSGSLVQQNHGETNDKGFLLWDIQSKDDFTVEHVHIENPKPFMTIELTKQGRMPKNLLVPEGARLRLVSNNNLPLDRMRKAIDVAKSRFKPTAVTFLNRAIGERAELENAKTLAQEDTRDITVQEKLIKEYLQDYEVEDGTLEKVFKLNNKYNSDVEKNEDISRNVNWKVKSISWDNLFNYGEGNRVNFENLGGIVGIFGKNYSGKSSIIDGILFTLFNSTSKNERKNLNIINQNKDWGQGKLEIEIGDKSYTIMRQCEKYIKKLKGKETLEAKTDLEFTVYDPVDDDTTELNGTSRSDTDKRIRKIFGTLEDFLITSMSSQQGAMTFINEGSTKRKELLAKFLDLEIFDKKFKMAKEDASDLRGALRRMEGREFDEEITVAKQDLSVNEKKITAQRNKCKKMEADLCSLQEDLKNIQQTVDSIPTEIIDILSLKEKLKANELKLVRTKGETKVYKEDLQDVTGKLEKAERFLLDFDIDIYKEKERQIENIGKQIDSLSSSQDRLQTLMGQKRKKISLLDEVPCGNEFKHCKFIKDAYGARESIVVDEHSLAKIVLDKGRFTEDLETLDPDKTSDYIEKHRQLLERCQSWKNALSKYTLQIEKNNAVINSVNHENVSLQEKIEEYEKNKEAIENVQGLMDEKFLISNKIKKHNSTLQACKGNILTLYKENGSLEQEVVSLEASKAELESLREEFSCYDLYMRCMHPNGISYDVIKKKLPVINAEIAKVLANVVDFEVFFEEDGKKLNILIKHPKYDARPLEMGSGAEKTIAAMAIRLALLSVSTLPKPNLFILDEPGTALDETNMEGFVRILDMVKSYFKTVLLISHLDSLKDCVDRQITIERKGDFAHVNHLS